jgi:hypothetical protein
MLSGRVNSFEVTTLFIFFTVASNHLNINITTAVTAVLAIFTSVLGTVPRYKIHGGSPRENIALQNLQASADNRRLISHVPHFHVTFSVITDFK